MHPCPYLWGRCVFDLEMRVAADELIAGGQTLSDAQVFMRVRDEVANIDYIRAYCTRDSLIPV